MESFSGRRLEAARIRSGQPVEAIALKVGRGAECVRRYLRGTIDPPASMVAKLADAVGVPVADLFEDDEHQEAA